MIDDACTTKIRNYTTERTLFKITEDLIKNIIIKYMGISKREQIGIGLGILAALIGVGLYFLFFHESTETTLETREPDSSEPDTKDTKDTTYGPDYDRDYDRG